MSSPPSTRITGTSPRTSVKQHHSQFLANPWTNLWYRLCLSFRTQRIISMAGSAGDFHLFPGATLSRRPPAQRGCFHTLVLRPLLQFFISYALPCWRSAAGVSTFIFILFRVRYLASAIVPARRAAAAAEGHPVFTPFPYQLSFPISIYNGQGRRGRTCGRGCVQFLWVRLAYVLRPVHVARGVRSIPPLVV